jgi:hypothetical protein
VTMPRSTMEMVGISGSMTVSRSALMDSGIVRIWFVKRVVV